MKNFLNYAVWLLALSGISFFSSCSDDDDDGPSREVSYKGETYILSESFVIDYGNFYPGYTNYDFILTDGQFTSLEDEITNATVVVYAELISPDENAFLTGTYTFDDSADPGDNRFFYDAGILIDENDDQTINELDAYIEATGGTIQVSGDPYNYTLTFNLTLEGGEALTGSYAGSFTYRDESDGSRFPDGSGLRLRLMKK